MPGCQSANRTAMFLKYWIGLMCMKYKRHCIVFGFCESKCLDSKSGGVSGDHYLESVLVAATNSVEFEIWH